MKNKLGWVKFVWAPLLAWMVAAPCLGFVSTAPYTTSAMANRPVYIPVTITTDQEFIAGINGELVYDSSYFHSPSISTGAGSNGFIALGNETEAGHYRFVLYHDPTMPFSIGLPQLYFRLIVADTNASAETTLSYTGEAASDMQGEVSLPDVDFSDVIIRISNSVTDWILYE